ncbi:PREDICTED: RING finger and SPRY domain-containing protein 1-like [Papilio polytes]|uniref:RING finger and SPRY domain-containing protein 1-like n=1 Tax=Papilio polytes TaxID=76194 RepID=UPI000676B144|nr:PREDICTED: RING finger and SPRY domain-containing protein 1-like [Papilio polytes]XP_013138467.1 PREDICTED: RING finger and SPRY domain-containing protein 1-like [Papilio polytes]
MAGTLSHLNGLRSSHILQQNGVWDPQFVRNVIMRSLQKLSPRNRVACRFDTLMEFIVNISQHSENWLTIVTCLMGHMPVDSNTTAAILIIMRAIHAPDVATVTNLLTNRFNLGQRRALAPILDIEIEKNICIVLNCLAEKFVGNQSTLVFTHDVCSYLCNIFVNDRFHNDAELQKIVLLTLEKFSAIAENKKKVLDKLAELNVNHLPNLEKFYTDTSADDGIWREIRYCARWTLDNIFPINGRHLSYETVDTSRTNAMFNNNEPSQFLKYSPDLMEIRNDTIQTQTLYGTCHVKDGKWYYEISLITNGSFVIGWAITGADMTASVGFEEFSVGYEGSKKLMWYFKNAYVVGLGVWKRGDVLGCLLDITNKTITFFLNGKESIVTSDDFFAPTEETKKFFPAITIAPFQQCVVNLGNRPFRNPPAGVRFSTFNAVGELSVVQKRKFGIPRRVLQQEGMYNEIDDTCSVCYDRAANVTLLPCQHRILCRACSIRIWVCPICRSAINERV